MRMAELSRRSGVPVATIKYYRREGLLAPGLATSPNQADYNDAHLDRLRLIRALREVADLPIASLRAVLVAVDDPDAALRDVVATAHTALASPTDDPVRDPAFARVDALVRSHGWQISPTSPARRSLARALQALEDVGSPATDAALGRYVEAADTIARGDVDAVAGTAVAPPTRTTVVRDVVVGTVLYEHVLTALRRLAHEHHSAAVLRQ